MGDITLGQYFPGDSPIHKMDPRTKIIMTVVLIAIVFLAKGVLSYVLILGFVLYVSMLSRINLMVMLKGLKPLIYVIVLTVVLNVFFAPNGRVLFRLGFITVTAEGIETAVYMAVRLMLLIFSSQLLTLTTSPIALTDGLESLMRPLSRIGFPSHEIAMMMSIALRFIPTLLEEADKIMKAQKARGADFESGNLMARAKAMLPLLVPLFISAFRRADELALAMEARCYRGGANRTRMKILKFSRVDSVATGVLTLVTVLVIVLSNIGW